MILGLLAGLGFAGCDAVPDEGVARGEALFNDYCAPCHGVDGTGKQGVGAPGIAGLDAWYVERQFHKFKDGVRGADARDIAGLRMRPMARTLATDNDIALVAEYVASMPVIRPEAVLAGGDPDRGKELYATCAACHGPEAAGNEILNAPPLNHSNDWYMLTQLKHFKDGVRGANPDDMTGASMRPMAMTLQDEQAMKDVVAYIQTLGK
jgi:cytochrome c oxidase subunit 2